MTTYKRNITLMLAMGLTLLVSSQQKNVLLIILDDLNDWALTHPNPSHQILINWQLKALYLIMRIVHLPYAALLVRHF